MLELDSFGLTGFWRAQFSKMATACVSAEEPLRMRKLSISHLSGTFVVLAIGFSLGLLTFLIELIIHGYRTRGL